MPIRIKGSTDSRIGRLRAALSPLTASVRGTSAAAPGRSGRIVTALGTLAASLRGQFAVPAGRNGKFSSALGALAPSLRGTSRAPVAGGIDWSAVPAAGQWAQYGLNRLGDVKGPNPTNGTTIGFGPNDNAMLESFAGGVLVPLYGSRPPVGSIVVGPAGGHNSYNGNDIYAFDPVTRLWSRVRDTYNPTGNPNSFGEYPDGSLFPIHTWDTADYVPIGAKGSILYTWGYVDQAANGTPRAHLYDLATNTWTRGGLFTNQRHPAVAYDPARRCLWHMGDDVGPLQRSVDGQTITSFAGNSYAFAANSVACIDWRRDQFVHYVDNSSGSAGLLYVHNLNSPSTAPSPISLNAGPGNDCTFCYVGELDRIVAWSGSGKLLYVLDPNNYAAGWTTIGSGSTQTPPTIDNFANQGANGKFQYVPAMASIVGSGGNGQYAWAHHLQGVQVVGSELDDWNARISGPGVVWYHNFQTAAEVNAFRWVEAYGQDPGDTRDPGKCIWSPEGFAGGGSMKQIRLAGSVESQSNWWRPFAPLTGASNGRGVNDPAANGTLTLRSMVAVQGQETIRNMGNFGYYGSATYAGQGGFDGTEIYIQARVKMPAARIQGANANVSGGKLFFFTNNRQAFSTQEIVTMSGWSDGGSPAKNAFQMYRQGGQSLPNDESPFLGYQPGGSVGLVGNGQANWADSTRANFWTWPGDTWVTVLFRLVPGTSGGGNTTIEVWVAEIGETSYRRIWSQRHANITFQGAGDATNGNSGYNALICDTYVNAINMNPGFTNQWTQIIASKQWIPPPRYY